MILAATVASILAVAAGAVGAEIRRAAAERRASDAEARATLALAELGALRARDAKRRADVWRLVEVMHEDRRAGETWRTAIHIQGIIDDEDQEADHG